MSEVLRVQLLRSPALEQSSKATLYFTDILLFTYFCSVTNFAGIAQLMFSINYSTRREREPKWKWCSATILNVPVIMRGKNQISADLAHLEIMRGYNLCSTTYHMLSRSLGQKTGNDVFCGESTKKRQKDIKCPSAVEIVFSCRHRSR